MWHKKARDETVSQQWTKGEPIIWPYTYMPKIYGQLKVQTNFSYYNLTSRLRIE